jgi:hypothetical protein
MTTNVYILAHDGAADQLAYSTELMRTYGITANVRSLETALFDFSQAVWLTLERRQVPVLALLSDAWSTDLLGGLGNMADAASVRGALADFGLQTSAAPVRGAIEGYVWSGQFRVSAISGTPSNGTTLVDAGQRICTRLGIVRSYMRIEFDDLDAIVDVSPVPGNAAMIGRARLAGFCPLWTSYCVLTGSDPLMPLLNAGLPGGRTRS